MKTLLIVDEAQHAGKMADFFSYHQFRTVIAQNGNQAITLLDDIVPEGLLLSVRLTDMSGLKVLEYAKRRNPETLIMMLSAPEHSDEARQALKRGASDFLVKPLQDQDLEWMQVFFCPEQWNLEKVSI